MTGRTEWVLLCGFPLEDLWRRAMWSWGAALQGDHFDKDMGT